MDRFKDAEFWVAILGALAAVGLINMDIPQMNDFAEQIVTTVAVLVAIVDTIRRKIT